MFGSLCRVAVWLTSALCAFTLVAHIKFKRYEAVHGLANTDPKLPTKDTNPIPTDLDDKLFTKDTNPISTDLDDKLSTKDVNPIPTDLDPVMQEKVPTNDANPIPTDLDPLMQEKLSANDTKPIPTDQEKVARKAKDVKQSDRVKPQAAKISSKSNTPPPTYPEHILSYVFFVLGIIMCVLAIVYEQRGKTHYVSVPLLIGLMFMCFGLGGFAAMVICAFLPAEKDVEGLSNLACAVTGVVFVAGMMLFERVM